MVHEGLGPIQGKCQNCGSENGANFAYYFIRLPLKFFFKTLTIFKKVKLIFFKKKNQVISFFYHNLKVYSEFL